ncbi:MAG TPA: DEAD/DEAH box helicase, partial [Steroidobacteraceae bacterium]|nr:DEAD/DEAH box helicase [Steroidobacteraceae bacterium]
MATIGGFIGIDRYNDPRIRDLSGAKRDAVALWALLSDSIAELDAIQLVDADATLVGVRELLSRTLDAATNKDVVILSFAGHGTPDHRLVVADTEFINIPATTIAMAELADRFKASKARCIFCILDCCFSGGAPARVLEDAPGLRAIGIPLEDVAGRGRVLIAASNVDEPALEDPVTRHGLFTKALLECLQEATPPVSLVGVLDQVVRHVRATAARLGRVQTPVLFGHVEGELTFPALKRGARFIAEFPEYAPVKVTSAFQDLTAFGIGPEVVSLWQSRFPKGLNSLQQSAINDYGVLSGRSFLTVAPTSAGKTFIGEVAAIKAIQRGEKAVFLLPYKAIVNEKFEEFSELYGQRLGLRIARCSGDWQDQTGAILRGKYDIAFFTYETFLNLAVASSHLLSQVGLVVLDEAQFITDARRGIIVELLLTNLVSARRRGIEPQLIALSAVIGNTNSFEKWLGCGLLVATQRPVPLVEGVMDRAGQFQAQDITGTVSTSELLPRSAIRIRKQEAGSQDMIVPLVKSLVANGEKVIVFRNTRGAAA